MLALENGVIVSAAVSSDFGSLQVNSDMAGTGIVRLTAIGVQRIGGGQLLGLPTR
jgi:hypothetical protein